MFATKITDGLYRVSHCAAGRKTIYKVNAEDAFSAILKLLTRLRTRQLLVGV